MGQFAHPDARHAALARRDQPDAIAVRIDERLRRRGPLPGDPELAVAAPRRLRERLARVVQLEHRAVHAVAVLVVAPAGREQLLEGEPRFLLPERQHRVPLVREQRDVDVGLRQLHGGGGVQTWRRNSTMLSVVE